MEEGFRPAKKVMQFTLPGHNVILEKILNGNNTKVIEKQVYANTKEAYIMLYLEWEDYGDDIYDPERSPLLHHMDAFDVASQHNEINRIMNDPNKTILMKKQFACPKEGVILLYLEWLDKDINDDIIDDENSNLTADDL